MAPSPVAERLAAFPQVGRVDDEGPSALLRLGLAVVRDPHEGRAERDEVPPGEDGVDCRVVRQDVHHNDLLRLALGRGRRPPAQDGVDLGGLVPVEDLGTPGEELAVEGGEGRPAQDRPAEVDKEPSCAHVGSCEGCSGRVALAVVDVDNVGSVLSEGLLGFGTGVVAQSEVVGVNVALDNPTADVPCVKSPGPIQDDLVEKIGL